MDEEDYNKLTVENACAHKVWKARLVGYESARKHFQQIEDEKSPEWNKYIGLVKLFVVDSHVLCQEKGLEAVLIFVENCGNAGYTASDVSSGIIQKCLASPKTRIRELAAQVILMYIEIEKYEIVFEELIRGTESKNPKVVAACVHILAQALKEFGSKVINVSKLMKNLPKLLDDRDGNVRLETKMLIGMVYYCLGPVIKPQLTVILKPAQLAEVENEYEKLKTISAKATRLLRSQQVKVISASVTDEGVREREYEECGEDESKSYSILEPVDVLSKLDKNFYTKLKSKKWSERKEVLEEFEKHLSTTPKLEPTDYSEMVRTLKNIITTDSNVVVVGIAIKCITGIANGLKKKFHQYVPLIIPALFEKFKEKKQNIVAALREAVDTVYLTTSLEAIHEDIVNNLNNKNPCVKSEISGFLGRCFSKSTPNILTKKLLKILCKSLTNGLRDQDPTVRDNSAVALGTAMKVVGEKAIGPFLVEIDPLMLKKIKEFSDKVKISLKQQINEEPTTISKQAEEEKQIPRKANNTTSEKSQTGESFKKLINRGNSQANREGYSDNELVNEIKFNNQALDNKPKVDISNQITDQLVAELEDKNWQVRAKAVEKLQGFVNSSQSITCNLGEIAHIIAARISDSNTRISAGAIALVESLAPAIGPSFKQYIRIFLPPLMKAIGDPKIWIRSAVIPCFNTWGQVCGFKEFFEGELIADALKTGSTTVRSELWTWLSNLLPNIPNNRLKKEELTACLPTLYSNLEDRNSDVRKNANDAVLGFMLHLGFTNMIRVYENIKGSGSTQVKQILEKTRGSLPVQPMLQTKPVREPYDKPSPSTAKFSAGSTATITNSKTSTSFSKSATSSRQRENQRVPLLQVNSLKTQRIIDEQKLKTLRWNFLTPTPEFFQLLREQMIVANVDKTLVAHMFHNDFRYHIRAIDALNEHLPFNKEALISNLDLILRWMSLRFFDTNPSVLLKVLEYLNSVFSVLREEEYIMMDSEASSFIPYLMHKVGNPKDTIRNSVRAILKQISIVYPVNKQFFYVMEGLKSKNARQRSECLEQLGWLIENYGISVCNPSPAGALKEIAKLIADRDVSVRNAALNCVMTAYFLEGDKTLKWVGLLSGKNMPLLEERIRRAAKSPPTNIVKPLNVSAGNVSADQAHHEDVMEMSRGSDTHNVTGMSRNGIPNSRVSVINGAYSFDEAIIDKIECTTRQFQAPKLVDIDLQFLEDQTKQPSIESIPIPKMTPHLSNNSQPAAIIHELLNIDSNDIDRAMAAISRIDIILNSENWHHLAEFVDLMVSQLVYLMIILNGSEHPLVLNCYRANFSLLKKLCNHPELCSKITDTTLYKILEQLLYLLTEPRSDMLDKQDMFDTFVKNLVIMLFENSNKTNILCALLKILYGTVNNPKVTDHYNNLVIQWIHKLYKSQSEWDPELDYCRILNEFDIFLKNYPTSWWKTKANDVPLRILKTLLYGMVKTRGTEVRTIFKKMPNVSKDCELYNYIKKSIKYVKMEMYSKDYTSNKENKPRDIIHYSSKISKETKCELSNIFGMIGDFEKTSQGMKKLFEFEKSHPETNVQTFLSNTTPQFQQFIKQGLQALEHSASQGVKSKEHFTKEAEMLWNRLKHLQEKLGYQVDKNKEDVTDRLKELSNVVAGINIK
ncbi:protein mini spindles [Halyomorpha halys]|uniref:protein mini spindles n=1 Tax=Halyomorpha halys TaxID=286706 RepID=UPI0006D523D7|nr:cytoskeleton-associated protein 5 [Halyomorpha halys]